MAIAYDGFFAGFRSGSATGFFATLDENLPVWGGFGSPRILMLLFAIGYFLLRSGVFRGEVKHGDGR
jgi:hypothetical protein